MSNYDNEMSGALFKNDKRETDSQPHAKGSCQIEGVEYWVSAWTNTSKTGQKYQSLKFSRKEQAHNQGMQQAKKAIEPELDDDSDLPF